MAISVNLALAIKSAFSKGDGKLYTNYYHLYPL